MIFYILLLHFYRDVLQVFCVDGQTSYQVKKTERSGTSCLCTFASSCRLASCAPVDLFLLYRASLIAFFVFMESNSLLKIFSIFMTPLSISFFRSLYCYDCDKSVSSSSCVFFHVSSMQKTPKILVANQLRSSIKASFFSQFLNLGGVH